MNLRLLIISLETSNLKKTFYINNFSNLITLVFLRIEI